MGRILFCWLGCLIWSLVAFAFPRSQQQQPPQQQSGVQRQPPTYEVEAAMVVVDVTVRDRKGNLLGDLKKEDFKIYEDNVPQEIIEKKSR